MMLQLNPMLPVYIPRFNMEGYAFLVTKESQEHYTMYSIALDNGEIWDLSNREVRFCINYSMDRSNINTTLGTQFRGFKQQEGEHVPR